MTKAGPSSYRVEQERYLTDSSLEGQGAASPYGYRCRVCVLSLHLYGRDQPFWVSQG